MNAGDRIKIFQSCEVFKPGQPLAPRILAIKGQRGTVIDMAPDGVRGGALCAIEEGEFFVPYAALELDDDS